MDRYAIVGESELLLAALGLLYIGLLFLRRK
jgi:hypothetical protein